MAKKEVTYKFGANTAEVDKKLAQMSSKMKDLGKSMQQFGKSMSLYVTAPLAAMGAMAVKAFGQQEAAERKLSAALKATGGDVDNNMRRFKKFASDLQSVTTVGDEVTLSMLQMATTMGLNSDASERAVKNAIAMESAFGVSAASAMRYTAALEDGDATMLKRYIPALKAIEDESLLAAKAQEILGNAFSVAKENALTFSGQTQQLKNSFGDLMEEFGAVIAQALVPLVEMLKQAVNWMQGLDERTKKIVVVIASLAAAVGPLLITLGFLTTTIIPALVAGGAMIASAWAPITLLILGVAAAYVVLNKEMKANKTEVDKLAKANTVDELKKEANEVNNLIIKLRKEREKPVRKRVSPDAGDGVVYRMDNKSLDELIQKELQRSINLEAAIKAKKQADIDAAKAAEEALKQQQQIEDSLRAQLKAKKAHLGVVGQLQAKIAELNDQMKFQNTAEDVAKLNAEIEKTQAQLDAILNPVDSVKRKFEEIPPLLESIKAKMLELDGVIAEPIKKLGQAIYDLIPISDTVAVRFIQMFDAFGNKIRDTREVIIDLGKELSYLATDVLVSLSESMGNAFNGGTFEEGLNDLLITVADWAQDFGKILIAAGIASAAFQKSLAVNPLLAIGAGVALIAAATAVKGALSQNPMQSGSSSGYSGGGGKQGSDIFGMRDLGQFSVAVTGTLRADGNELITVIENENKRTRL